MSLDFKIALKIPSEIAALSVWIYDSVSHNTTPTLQKNHFSGWFKSHLVGGRATICKCNQQKELEHHFFSLFVFLCVRLVKWRIG